MRSAYGLEFPAEDAELTHVGPGTPCGELMRRYWRPICPLENLTDLPKKVRILGEGLVAFRDGRDRCSSAAQPSRRVPRVRAHRGCRYSLMLSRLAVRR